MCAQRAGRCLIALTVHGSVQKCSAPRSVLLQPAIVSAEPQLLGFVKG